MTPRDAAIAAKSNRIVSFSCPHAIARVALDRGYHWVTTTDGPLVPGEYLVPDTMTNAMGDWMVDQGLSGSDGVALWAMLHGELVWHAVPSLVDAGVVRPTPDMATIDWSGDAVHGGTTGPLHRRLLGLRGPRQPLVEAYYRCAGEYQR